MYTRFWSRSARSRYRFLVHGRLCECYRQLHGPAQIARAKPHARSVAYSPSNAADQELPDDMRMPLRGAPLEICESPEHPVQRHDNPDSELSTPTFRFVPKPAAAGRHASGIAHTRRCGASDDLCGVVSISKAHHLGGAQKPSLSVVHRQGLDHEHARAWPVCQRLEARC